MAVRSRQKIEHRLASDPAYREDMEYIHETLTHNRVFIGQIHVAQGTDQEWVVTFTVGMFNYELPELVLTGVPVAVVENIIEELCGHATDFNREFLDGTRSKVIEGFNVVALGIERPSALTELQLCQDYYTLYLDKQLRACQLVFANGAGIYPWSREYAEADRRHQKILAMPATMN
jgi:hypothetical protein